MITIGCPKCGCNDVAQTPGCDLWGVPGIRCHCNRCGGLFYTADPDSAAAESAYAAQYAVQKCPRCASKKTHVTSTRKQAGVPTVRYHRCDGCNKPFKTVEAP